jgi:hypothetical protein
VAKARAAEYASRRCLYFSPAIPARFHAWIAIERKSSRSRENQTASAYSSGVGNDAATPKKNSERSPGRVRGTSVRPIWSTVSTPNVTARTHETVDIQPHTAERSRASRKSRM